MANNEEWPEEESQLDPDLYHPRETPPQYLNGYFVIDRSGRRWRYRESDDRWTEVWYYYPRGTEPPDLSWAELTKLGPLELYGELLDAEILLAIAEHPGSRRKQLGTTIGLPQHVVGRRLKRVLRRLYSIEGLIRGIAEGTADGYGKTIFWYLTEKGEERVAELKRERERKANS